MTTGRRLFYAVPFAWFAAFLLVPFVLVLKISVADAVQAQPPYTPLFGLDAEGTRTLAITFANYRFIFGTRCTCCRTSSR
jgi:putrescine transport system permease protein